RAVLETLLEFARRELPTGGLSLSLTTKSNLVLKDVDLLRELARCARLRVNLSLTTLNPRLARVLEPRAPRPELRLEAVRALNEEGVPAGVFACPVLPGITDRREGLEALVAAAKSAGARYLCAEAVFLMPSSQKKFFPFLERKFPRLVKQYRKWYTRNGYAPEAYRRQIAALVGQLRLKHGLPGAWPDLPTDGQDDDRPPRYDQLAALGPGTVSRPQMALPFAC
ncbi:MAG: radical SAM protein, partial [Terriglobia bacterium]